MYQGWRDSFARNLGEFDSLLVHNHDGEIRTINYVFICDAPNGLLAKWHSGKLLTYRFKGSTPLQLTLVGYGEIYEYEKLPNASAHILS
uniref:Uncharacterized protein n=1 Tax=viral metagenome TaxID=1070528 RepID=A0A6M3IFP2_9ZZZZ